MALKDLLVHIDLSDAGRSRADYGFDLAEAQRAHVIGVGYAPVGIVPFYGAPDLFMPPPVEYFEKLRDEAGKALEAFAAAGKRRGLSTETRLIETSGIDFAAAFCVHARHADLTLIGQPQDDMMAGGQHALLEQLLFGSGRPVLVTPWTGAGKADPATVMIAWDGSGTAARAVNDALPFLQRAKTVVVLAIDDGRADIGEQPGADIARHLARHGIDVSTRDVPGGRDIAVGDLLLSQAADLGAELMVMGGYHHSRVREYVLGGVTRTIVNTMTLPVLMAH